MIVAGRLPDRLTSPETAQRVLRDTSTEGGVQAPPAAQAAGTDRITMPLASSWPGQVPARQQPARCLVPVVLATLFAAPALAADDKQTDSQSLPPIDVQGNAVPAAVDAVDVRSLTGRVQRIDADDYRARPLELADVLARQAGLQVRRTGGFASFTNVSIRGASADQVDVTLNGLPLAPSVTGGFNFGAIALRDLAGVDVYAGYAPIELSTGGPGGVINLRTPDTRQPWETSTHASYGEAATVQTGLRSGLRTGPVTHGLSVGHAASDNDFAIINTNRAFDPSDPDRSNTEPRRNADARRDHGLYTLDAPLGELAGGAARVSLLAQAARQEQGLPDARNSAAARTRLTADQTNLQARVSLRDVAGAPVDLAWRGFTQRNALTYDDRASQVGLGAQFTDSDQRQTGTGLLARAGVGPWRWAGHVQFTRETYAADDRLGTPATQSGRREHVSAALRSSRDLADGRWLLSATLRHRRIDDRFAPASGPVVSDTRSATNPQVGVRWQPTDALRVHANAGRYLRLPTFFERYGDRGLFIGNNGLDPERGRNANLGVRLVGADWHVAAEAYASVIDDAIVTQFDVLSGIGRAENVAGARIAGLEIDTRRTWPLAGLWGSQSPGWAVDVAIGAAAQDTENRADGVNHGKQLPGRFETKWFSRIGLQMPAGLEAFHEFVFVDGGFYDTLNSRPAPTTRQHTLGVRARRRVAGALVDAGVEIRNATDAHFEDFNAQPLPPRQAFASVEVVFNP